jgi:hypothetical protein
MTTIAHEYNKLTRTPSGHGRGRQCDVVRRAIWDNQREFVLICADPDIAARMKMELIRIAGHGGSVWLKDNEYLVPLLREVYANLDLLPDDDGFRQHLDWLIHQHGYPLK